MGLFKNRVRYWDSGLKIGTPVYYITLDLSETAYYPLNENVNDYSGNMFNGTPYDITYVAGKKNNCASFNGTSSWFNTGSLLALFQKNYSITFWIKTVNSLPIFCTAYDSVKNGNSTLITMANGYVQFHRYITSSIAIQTAFNIYNNNNWHFVYASYDGTNMILDVNNGYDRVSVVDTRTDITSYEAAFGKDYYNSSRGLAGGYFNGNLDDIKIYDRPLTKDEIRFLYTNNPVSRKGNLKYYDTSLK